MNAISTRFFDSKRLRALAAAASQDDFVARHSTLADVRMGFRNTETKESAWISVNESGVEADTGPAKAAFCFAGDTAAFADLCRGFPFNRLVRQHRLVVEGDLRGCVQNWLLIYALTRLAAQEN